MKKLKKITVGHYANYFATNVSKARMIELLTDSSTDCYNKNIDLRYAYVSIISYGHNSVWFDNKGNEHFCDDYMLMEYQEYEILYQKQIDKTITPTELDRLYVLAFGEEYMNSSDKGTLKEYAI